MVSSESGIVELFPTLASKKEIPRFINMICHSTQYTSLLGWMPRNSKLCLLTSSHGDPLHLGWGWANYCLELKFGVETGK